MAKEAAPKGDYFVYSTLSNDQIYRDYQKAADERVIPSGQEVFIAGGANRASDVTTRQGIYTPNGMVTGITTDELELLQRNDMFLLHQRNGFIKVSKKFSDADEVAEEDMEAADASAPLTPEKLDAEAAAAKDAGGNAPIVADSSRAPPAPATPTAARKA